MIGAELIGHIGPDGVLGDLLFVLTGLMFAVFGTLLRHWRVNAFSAATVISVLSLSLLPLYAASGGFARVAALGLGENALQALAQGILAGPAALYLFAFSIQTIGVARAAVFPATVPALTILAGWLLLGEPPTALQAAGLVTVLFGILSGAEAKVGVIGLRALLRDLAACFTRGLKTSLPSLEKRAQGRPGACCTRGLVCNVHQENAHEHTGTGGASRPFLRSGFTAYFVLFPENGSFASVACASYRKLSASTAAPEPRDFAVRIRRVRLARLLRPPHPTARS